MVFPDVVFQKVVAVGRRLYPAGLTDPLRSDRQDARAKAWGSGSPATKDQNTALVLANNSDADSRRGVAATLRSVCLEPI